MTSRNASKTGSAAGIFVKPQKGATLKVMLVPNAQGKPFCVLSHQSGNLLTTPRIYCFSTARVIAQMPLCGVRLNVLFLCCFFFNDEYLLGTNNIANNLKPASDWCIYLVLFILEYLKTGASYVTRHFASQDSRQDLDRYCLLNTKTEITLEF